jgi:phosphatidylinositol alpha-1,6-mannosyltransferase
VCRLDDIGKGVDVCLRVVDRLRRRFPYIRYVVVGDGPLRGTYERMSREFGIERNVIFAGRLPDTQLPQCYAASDLFALLSRRVPEIGYYEGYGIAYREAMACGKPALVSREAGYRDYVVDGCSSLLIDPNRAQEMGRCAARLASQPTDWSALNEL